jgi:hypothetical protein
VNRKRDMKFDIDSKIKENRERLRFDLERIEKISNNYPFYLIFISFIGIYIFDFIVKAFYIVNLDLNTYSILFLCTLGLSLILIIFSIIYFILLFLPQKTAHDFLPKEIYVDYKNEIEDWISNENNPELIPEDELKKSYLETLEIAVEDNFNLYTRKRSLYFKTIIWGLLSLIPYIVSIVLYKSNLLV